MDTAFYERCKSTTCVTWPFIKITCGAGDSVRNRKDPEHKFMLIHSKLCGSVFPCVRISSFDIQINYI